MKIIEIRNDHLEITKNWKLERLEERTCRPVVNGKRIPSSNEITTLAFISDDSEEPAGIFFYFDHNKRNRSCEFGYIVRPDNRNQGIGTKMIKLCTDKIFRNEELNLNKLYCQTAAFNLQSNRILEKLGFHKDGILREHHELDGVLRDDYIYSILRSEWK